VLAEVYLGCRGRSMAVEERKERELGWIERGKIHIEHTKFSSALMLAAAGSTEEGAGCCSWAGGGGAAAGSSAAAEGFASAGAGASSAAHLDLYMVAETAMGAGKGSGELMVPEVWREREGGGENMGAGGQKRAFDARESATNGKARPPLRLPPNIYPFSGSFAHK
jgi:hypothetical protein